MTKPKAFLLSKPQLCLNFLLLILALAFLASALLVPGETRPFDSEPARDFGADWFLLNDAGEPTQPLHLPAKIDSEGPIRMQKQVPSGISAPAVLGFRSAHQKVRLYCNDTLIYSFGYSKQPPFGKSPGSAWNIVRLPADCEGSTLRLELDTPYSFYDGKLPVVQLGSKAALLFSLLRPYILPLSLTLVILAAAIATLLVYFLVIRKNAGLGQEMLHLGLFALFISFWLFGECRLTQFFAIPPVFNTAFTFLAMIATPIPLIHYISVSRRDPRMRRGLAFIAHLFTLLFASSIFLQVSGLLDFIEQLPLIHTLTAVAAISILAAVLLDGRTRRDAMQSQLLISLFLLAFFFFMETYLLYFGGHSVGSMMRIGVLVFIAIQARTAFQNAAHMLHLSRLATIDVLTGCFNRTAYSQFLEELAGEEAVGILIADINDLKHINDKLGHDVGDDAIVRCARCFTEAFSPLGRCFRIGGDEFTLLGRHLSTERLLAAQAQFEQLTTQTRAVVRYPFRISYGHALYEPTQDASLADAVRRADKRMYDHKRTLKQNAPIPDVSGDPP